MCEKDPEHVGGLDRKLIEHLAGSNGSGSQLWEALNAPQRSAVIRFFEIYFGDNAVEGKLISGLKLSGGKN
jgi:hypothetical protein